MIHWHPPDWKECWVFCEAPMVHIRPDGSRCEHDWGWTKKEQCLQTVRDGELDIGDE